MFCEQQYSSIVIPTDLLSKPTNTLTTANEPDLGIGLLSKPALSGHIRFPEKLKLGLCSYQSDRLLSITEAAGIFSMPTRTLQRELQNCGTSFHRIIEEIRYQRATSLLEDKDYKITDIAFELGYTDPGNFARAFKRFAGATPSQASNAFNRVVSITPDTKKPL